MTAKLTHEQVVDIEHAAKSHFFADSLGTLDRRCEVTLQLVAEWREYRAQHSECTCSDGTCASCKHSAPDEAHRHEMFVISQKLEGRVLELERELRNERNALTAARQHLRDLAMLTEHSDNAAVRRIAQAALTGVSRG